MSSEPTWEQHLAWCKKRALAYLPNDPEQAIASMVSDLRKHSEAPNPVTVSALMVVALMNPMASAVRDWINGWN